MLVSLLFNKKKKKKEEEEDTMRTQYKACVILLTPLLTFDASLSMYYFVALPHVTFFNNYIYKCILYMYIYIFQLVYFCTYTHTRLY